MAAANLVARFESKPDLLGAEQRTLHAHPSHRPCAGPIEPDDRLMKRLPSPSPGCSLGVPEFILESACQNNWKPHRLLDEGFA